MRGNATQRHKRLIDLEAAVMHAEADRQCRDDELDLQLSWLWDAPLPREGAVEVRRTRTGRWKASRQWERPPGVGSSTKIRRQAAAQMEAICSAFVAAGSHAGITTPVRALSVGVDDLGFPYCIDEDTFLYRELPPSPSIPSFARTHLAARRNLLMVLPAAFYVLSTFDVAQISWSPDGDWGIDADADAFYEAHQILCSHAQRIRAATPDGLCTRRLFPGEWTATAAGVHSGDRALALDPNICLPGRWGHDRLIAGQR